jgi:SAM-dependent methyltransferase
MYPGEVMRGDKDLGGALSLTHGSDNPFHQARIRDTIELLERHTAAGGRLRRLLDAGCGTGLILSAVKRRFPSLEAIGLDSSPAALERAAARLQGTGLVLCDICMSPFQSGQFDCVLLNNVIEHVEAPLSVLEAMRRLLAPGGCLIVSTPSRYRFENAVSSIIGRPLKLMATDHVTEYSVGQVVELLLRSGFEVSAVTGSSRRPAKRTFRNTVSRWLLKPTLKCWLTLVGSLHVLEPTAFFLAVRASESVGCAPQAGGTHRS